QAGVPHAVVALHVCSDVATEPHRLTAHDRVHGGTLGGLDVHVQVPHRVAADHVAQMFDGEHGPLRVLRARVIHQAHVVAEVDRDVLVEELLRGEHAVAVK